MMVNPNEAFPTICTNTRRRGQEGRMLQANELVDTTTSYEVCVVADSHLFLVLKPVDSSRPTLVFNSCNTAEDDASSGQMFLLNEGSERGERVAMLVDGSSEYCDSFGSAIEGVTVRDAIQLSEEEWPGEYNLVTRNCATRILRALQELSLSVGGGSDFDPDNALKDYLTIQLALNGIGTLAQSDPVTLTQLFGDGTQPGDFTDEEVARRLIERTVSQFQLCGNGELDVLLGEECDDGGENGSESSDCTKFCSSKSAWYCPEGFTIGDRSFECIPSDHDLSEGDAAENCCLGSEYSVPGTYNEVTGTCNFRPCPWLSGGVRLNETACVSGQSADICDNLCQLDKVSTGTVESLFVYSLHSPSCC